MRRTVMAEAKPEVNSEVGNFLDSIKVLGKYLLTPAGIGSIVPGALSLADVSLGFLPFSAPVRPAIYFFVFILVLFAFYYESARYSLTRPTSIEFAGMERRALIQLALGVACCAAYLPIVGFVDYYSPRSEEVLFTLLWIAALLAAIGIMEITRGFVILGMKVFIAQNRA